MVSEPSRSYAGALIRESEQNSGAAPPSSLVAATETIQQSSMATDASSPFTLLFNESPSAILVKPPLDQSNYSSWSRSMTMALEVRNKLGIVDGTVQIPAGTDPQYQLWRRCDIMVRSWILKAISSLIAQSVLHVETAKDLWRELKRRFSHGDPHRISLSMMKLQI